MEVFPGFSSSVVRLLFLSHLSFVIKSRCVVVGKQLENGQQQWIRFENSTATTSTVRDCSELWIKAQVRSHFSGEAESEYSALVQASLAYDSTCLQVIIREKWGWKGGL